MSYSFETWEATATRGDNRVLKVVGEGEATMGGYQFALEPDNEGIVPQPEVVTLRLKAIEPDVGPDVMTPIQVVYEGPIGDDERKVAIRGAGLDGPLNIVDA
jgi:hypothetical protein